MSSCQCVWCALNSPVSLEAERHLHCCQSIPSVSKADWAAYTFSFIHNPISTRALLFIFTCSLTKCWLYSVHWAVQLQKYVFTSGLCCPIRAAAEYTHIQQQCSGPALWEKLYVDCRRALLKPLTPLCRENVILLPQRASINAKK